MLRRSALLALVLLMAGAARSPAQMVVPACDMRCPAPRLCSPFDSGCQQFNENVVTCQARQADCQAKYTLYDAYLTQMGLGVTLYGLPAVYRQVLAPFYPNADLSQVRFGESNRQPADNATCDCDRIYFNSASYVQRLREGTLVLGEDGASFGWLLHELRHFEQCREVGSRDAYAKMWWDHLTASDLGTMIETGQWQSVHEQMQMENDASARRDNLLVTLEQCCIHPVTLGLVPPLTVSAMQQQPASAKEKQPVSLTVQASGGAVPLVYTWTVQGPDGSSQTLPAATTSAQFVPSVPGAWQVRLRVVQANGTTGALQTNHEEVRIISVDAVPPVVAGVSLSQASVVGGASLTGGVQVSALDPGETVTVELSSSHAAATLPATVAVTAGSNGVGSASFPISTGLVVGNTNAVVSARIGQSTSSAQLTVQGVALEGMKFSHTDALAGQLLEIELLLDRPPPVDIRIVLESSDPTLFGVPSEVVFRRGEQRRVVQVRVATELSRDVAVTVRARTALQSEPSRSQEIQLRRQR